MTRYGRRFWLLATALAGLAGYVDAIGFLKLDGLYVSFMSGNSTRMAVGVVTNPEIALLAGRLLLAFVSGVIGGTFLSDAAGARRKPIVLSGVALLLAAAAMADGRLTDEWTTGLMATAMGAANTVFQRDGDVSIGVTYMTGTLVKLGQRAARSLNGGPRWAWVPYLLLYMGLVTGAIAGAIVYPRLKGSSILIAAVVAGVLAIYAAILGRAEQA